ncbi:MAG TPA: hypothetical protein VJJ46_13850 [Anaerolineales bacterium]|nr:hypothetical protein [Anaerolineales bacterium]
MIRADLRQGVRSGLVLGVVVVSLLFLGATTTLSTLIGEGLGVSPPAGLVILLLLLTLWIGAQSARGAHHAELPILQAAIRGAVAGLSAGLIIGLTTYVLIAIHDTGADLRTYLFQVSPAALDLWSMERTPVTAALFHLGISTAGCLLGVAVYRLFRAARARWTLTGRLASARASLAQRTGGFKRNQWTNFALYVLVAAILFITPQRLNNYQNFTLGTVGIYVLMGLGLNIVVGLAGLLDLGYVVFFAVGAYTAALLTAPTPHNLMWNFWLVAPIGIILAAVIGVLLGIPVLRLRGDYLAIVTLGFGEIIRVLLKAESLAGFSNGPRGIPSIGQPSVFGQPFNSDRDFLYMIIVGVVIVIFLTFRLQESRVGRAWIAIREDETVARAMGINTLSAKLLAFGVGAAFAGLGGVLYASRSQFVGPDDFVLMVSINVLAVVIVGGMASVPGVIAGAFVLKGLPEILRELEAYRILAFGALLVVMMILRPEGIIPSRRRRLEMHETEASEEPSLAAAPAAEAGGAP